MAGPRFFGFVIGGSLPATLAANWLAGAWDQNAALCARHARRRAPRGGRARAGCWTCSACPPSTEGAFVTGATMANFTALAAARHAVLERAGWNVEADGLFGAPPITVIVGDEAHPTLLKSLGLLGLGRTRADARAGRRRRAGCAPTRCRALAGPTIVCLQAGNLNTGAFDPLRRRSAPVARAAGAWVHVDGAFGLWAARRAGARAARRGIELADSWATDAHKWLNVPYDSGLAFVREPGVLPAAMAITADYLPTEAAERNPADYTPELSRRARGVEVWAALRSLGRRGVADLIERNCRHARRFADAARARPASRS